MCNCKKDKTMNALLLPPPIVGGQKTKPDSVAIRSGACPFCLRKHLLKADGYAEEVDEYPTRDWEREQLLKNLLLAEDHAAAIGDAGFAVNGQLVARANANRDFFLNCVAYLSGTDASVASGAEAGTLVVGMDRDARRRFAVLTVAIVPSAVFMALALVAFRRRRRS